MFIFYCFLLFCYYLAVNVVTAFHLNVNKSCSATKMEHLNETFKKLKKI